MKRRILLLLILAAIGLTSAAQSVSPSILFSSNKSIGQSIYVKIVFPEATTTFSVDLGDGNIETKSISSNNSYTSPWRKN